MTLLPPPNTQSEDSRFWRQIRWPIIVIGMLAGHVTLMLTALVLALTIPDAINNVKDYEVRIDRRPVVTPDATSPAVETELR